MQEKEIMEAAERFCFKHNITQCPVEIVRICQAEGISVFEENLPKNVSGFIVIQNDHFEYYGTGRLIAVNIRDSASRRRFTIAHELAHYILHKDESQEFYAHRDTGQNGGIENEANIFASCVLMPKALVISLLRDLRENATSAMKIVHIAKNFAVSQDASRVRLEKLGF